MGLVRVHQRLENVAKGWIAAFRKNDTNVRQMLDDIA
jgi:hypothetical protein